MLGFAHDRSPYFEAVETPRLFVSTYIFFSRLKVETVPTQNIKESQFGPPKLCHRSAVFGVIIVKAESMETKWRTNPTEAAMLTFSRDKLVDARTLSERTWSQNMLCTNILYDN
jgi:hypothetical protein